ncbi:MAG: macro domain-containing protein [Anaerolineae bacterium]|nr:macro domain-containing protein [Anaerolineae bacterium]
MHKLILADIEAAFCEAALEFFDGLPNVEIVNQPFEHLPEFDCMVSAANSFGLMDGGVDEAIIAFFGERLMHRVQRYILDHFLGEQPVGTSFIIETPHPKHPYLAHTPTMRVPMSISRTDNVYRAMWAMLLAVRQHNMTSDKKINVVACPGLGTGYGKVPYRQAARQMALAYRHFLKPPLYLDWNIASERQIEVRYGGDMGLRIPPEFI